MADEIVGQKMGQYQELSAAEKEHFFGDGEGSVVAVGKVAAEGNNVNRRVKLSDIQQQVDYTLESGSRSIAHRPEAITTDTTPKTFKFLGIKASTGISFTIDEETGYLVISAPKQTANT